MTSDNKIIILAQASKKQSTDRMVSKKLYERRSMIRSFLEYDREANFKCNKHNKTN